MKNRFRGLFLCVALAIVAGLFSLSLPVQAAPPTRLSRISLEETNLKCADTGAFRVVYTFGADTVVIDSEAAMNWYVTTASLDRAQKEVRGEGKERCGYFLIDGKESSFPEEYRTENGFVTDTEGNLIVSESAMYETLQDMFNRYNLNAQPGTTVFQSTSGRTIYLGGAEPEQIAKVNMKKEYQTLKNAFLARSADESRVIYTQEVDRGEVETVGDTYIEIDCSQQHLYMYDKGELICETPVVTGNMSWGAGTPEGRWYIINRARNATLIGADYVTKVNYWMAFTYNGHGIHDSTWRTSGYGGDIYLYDGSHGCVNTPIDKVAFIFEHVIVGEPVLVFY